MRVQYAQVTTRTAYLSTEFGVEYATKLFGADAVAALPKISRGPRKGATKGMLAWRKADVGGWMHDGFSGRVVRPGFIDATITVDGREVARTEYRSFEAAQAAKAEAEKEAADAAGRQQEEWEEEYVDMLAEMDDAELLAYLRKTAARAVEAARKGLEGEEDARRIRKLQLVWNASCDRAGAENGTVTTEAIIQIMQEAA